MPARNFALRRAQRRAHHDLRALRARRSGDGERVASRHQRRIDAHDARLVLRQSREVLGARHEGGVEHRDGVAARLQICRYIE
jgi:hypothetical protein